MAERARNEPVTGVDYLQRKVKHTTGTLVHMVIQKSRYCSCYFDCIPEYHRLTIYNRIRSSW